jgi:hypothetical protein
MDAQDYSFVVSGEPRACAVLRHAKRPLSQLSYRPVDDGLYRSALAFRRANAALARLQTAGLSLSCQSWPLARYQAPAPVTRTPRSSSWRSV